MEAPYVMQAANELHVHPGWAVQVYNVAEALPNLINPFWMLPLLGVLRLKARNVVGYTFMQLLVHVPLVPGLLWLLGLTLGYVPPVMPEETRKSNRTLDRIFHIITSHRPDLPIQWERL